MDVGDTFVFLFSIVDGMALLFLTVYFVSFINIYHVRCATRCKSALRDGSEELHPLRSLVTSDL